MAKVKAIPKEDSDDQLDLFDPTPRAVRPIDWAGLPAHPLSFESLPDNLLLGTSSWSFPGWSGLLYDGTYNEQKLADVGLAAYARCPLLRCVSLDKSYYRPPEEAEFARLASQVDEGFRFIVKAPRDLLLPDPRRGFDVESLERHFLAPASRGLGQKLGVVLLQFPPGSWRAIGSTAGFLECLARLFARLRHDLSYSLEVRDSELLVPGLVAAMQATPVTLCASVHPKLPAPEKQLLAVPPTRGCPIVVRWNLRPSLAYEEAKDDFQPFNALKSPDPSRRQRLAHLIARALKAGRKVYATANNKAEGCAPLSLHALLQDVIIAQARLEESSSRLS